MINTVPKTLTDELIEFCRGFSLHKPVFVRSKPSADAVQSHCFDNVARKIERAGGEIVYGWAIWVVPGLYFEAEHHGIWGNRRGKLLDVSPQLRNAPKIVFLPDPDAIYDPQRYRSNVLKAAKGSAKATEFVELANARNALIDKYREGGTRFTDISPADQEEQRRLEQRLREIWLANRS